MAQQQMRGAQSVHARVWMCVALALVVGDVARAAESDALEEVIVTAEKRPETVQKTAISITTISGEDIAKRADNELGAMLRNVPSLQIENTPQGGAVYVRGVGMNGDSNYVDPSVSLTIDGVYTARSERMTTGLYDISRAEVLRGPQGTIYGRNSDGGAINIISNGPVIGSTETRVNLQTGNYDLWHGDFAQNIPVNDQLAFRVAGLREKRDGYFSNNGYSSDVTAGRVKGLFNATDAWTLQALLDYSREKGQLATTVPIKGSLGIPPFNQTNDPTCADADGGWQTEAGNPWYVDACHPADTIDYKFVTASLQSDLNLGWATLTVIPTWTRNKRYTNSNLVTGIAPVPFAGSMQTSITSETQKTGEVRLSSAADSALKWVVGYYYLWSNNGGTGGTGLAATTVTNTSGDTVTLYDTDNRGASPTTSKAPFGQITYPLTDTLRLTGGLRYTQDAKSQALRITSVAVSGYDSGLVVYNADYSATTYKAGVEYDVAPKSMAYAQVSTGYKAGGFDTSASPPKTYRPEHVKSYEVGIKNQFLDDRLQVNASLYYYDYTDLQVQYALSGTYPIPDAYIPDDVTNSSFQQYIANAGKGINKGAELETRYRFTPVDEIDVSATYTNAHYGDFNHVADPDLIGLDGQRMAFTPEHTVMVDYEHDWSVAGGTLTAQANTKLSSSYWGSVSNRASRPDSFQKGYTRSDASLSYASSGIWTTTLWVKNIEDKAQIQFGDFPLNRNVVSYPRTFGLSVGLKF
ncbi:MAG: TonB-dependent receptor [Steroidobacteraceae bacterium]